MTLFLHSKSGVIVFLFCVFLAIFSSSCNKKSPETTSTLLVFSTVTSMNTDVNTEATQSVTVTNSGAHEAKDLIFSIVNLPLFITEDRDNPCTNTSLSPGGTCAFVIHFKPTEAKSGNQYLTLNYIDASTSKQNSTVANIFYEGTIAPSALVFSSVRPMTAVIGDVPDKQTVTITNTGGSSANHLTLDSVQLPLLPITEDTERPCTNKDLAPKEFCSFVVSFKPTEHVNSSQSLTVHYVDANSTKKKSATVPVFYRDVPVTGDANLVFLNIEPMITFVDAAKEQTVTIINSGNSSATALSVQKLVAPLYIVKDDCSPLQTLDVNATCKLVVKLVDTAKTAGNLKQTIKINYNNSKQNTFATADIPYQIIASDPENRLTFQSVNKLMTTGINSSVSQIVTVLNHGQDVTGVQLVPLASTSFIKIDDDNCSGQSIKSQATCTFVVSFNPTTAVKLSRDLLALTYQKTGSDQAFYALSQYVSYQTNDKDSTDPSDAYVPNGDLGIYNDCGEPVWIEFTPVGDPATLPVPASDNLKLIQPGQSADFGIPTTGIPSLKFWAKKGCDENGIHCTVGQSADTHFSRTPSDPKNPPSDCDPKYGCQPSVDTLFESTFGCTEADRSKCAKDAKSNPLTNATFFDISLVDGYTIPMSTRVITNENEDNQECQGSPTPDLDYNGFSDCPQAENLTALNDNWSINSNPKRWDWDTISSNSSNQVIDPFWGSDLQKAIKGIDKTVWQNGVKDLQNNISQIPTTNPFKCYDSINGLKQTTIDLNSVDLRIKNPNSGGAIIACGSPKEILNGNRRWGALGIGNQCTEQIIPEHKDPKDPSKTIPDSPMSSVNQTYLDYNLVYSNPYTDSIMLNPTNPNKDTNPTWNNRWPSLSHFCKNAGNSSFCLDPAQSEAPRSGLAAIIGHSGPIFNSQYVQNIKKKSDQVYAWQYDDYAGTRVCNKRPKVVVTLCKKVE